MKQKRLEKLVESFTDKKIGKKANKQEKELNEFILENYLKLG